MASLRRILALSLLLAALAATLAACGKEEVSIDPVAQAATKTAGLGSSRVAVSSRLEGAGLPRALTFALRGEVDNRSQSGRFDADFSSVAAAAGGGRVGDPADLRGEIVFRDFVLYMRVPLFQRALPGDKEWAKLDLREATRQAGVDIGQLQQFSQTDPSQSLRLLRAVSGETKKVGPETVRGVETTRYRATIDLRKYPSLAPPAQRRQARANVDRLIELSGTRTLPTEVWVDDRGVVRRLRQSYSFKVTPESPQRVRITQSIEFFGFGVAVRAEPPPRDEVVDLSEPARQRGSTSQGRVETSPPS